MNLSLAFTICPPLLGILHCDNLSKLPVPTPPSPSASEIPIGNRDDCPHKTNMAYLPHSEHLQSVVWKKVNLYKRKNPRQWKLGWTVEHEVTDEIGKAQTVGDSPEQKTSKTTRFFNKYVLRILKIKILKSPINWLKYGLFGFWKIVWKKTNYNIGDYWKSESLVGISWCVEIVQVFACETLHVRMTLFLGMPSLTFRVTYYQWLSKYGKGAKLLL